MNKLFYMNFSVFFLTVLLFVSNQLEAQSHDSLWIARSIKLTTLMKDSLSLSDIEKQQIGKVNYSILKDMAIYMKSNADRSVIQKEIQRIENSRDSLYQSILSDEKFLKYLRIKYWLLSNY
jgi:hypothetical protein